jgi:exopolyphosphatase/guanosine-5'-triphosphate,3'-diphosphate pyrophosphatase
LKDDRRAVIGGGLAILYTLAVHFGIEALVPARGALRQGVVFDLDERRQALALPQDGHDLRDASVRELQRRFMVDAEQAARVTRIAESLYTSVLPNADPEQRRELLWACALHEAGMMISHHDHHRHSAYVLSHVDAAGFSQSQLRRIGELVLGQRGGLRKLEASLAQHDFAWQALCLRLAIIKCHARGEVSSEAWQLQRSGHEATLHCAPGWAETHPRTLFLLREEAEAWQQAGGLKLTLAA